MGEYADEAVDRLMGFGPRKRRGQPYDVRCDRCGKEPLRWRETDDGWRLFEIGQRTQPGNRAKQHTCGPDPSTDFD